MTRFPFFPTLPVGSRLLAAPAIDLIYLLNVYYSIMPAMSTNNGVEAQSRVASFALYAPTNGFIAQINTLLSDLKPAQQKYNFYTFLQNI